MASIWDLVLGKANANDFSQEGAAAQQSPEVMGSMPAAIGPSNNPGALPSQMPAPMPPQMRGGRAPASKVDSAFNDWMKGLQESQGLQKEGISDLQKQIMGLQQQPQQQDGLQKAIVAAADMWGGGNGKFGQIYAQSNPHLTAEQRTQAIGQLQDTLRKARGDLSDTQVKELKDRVMYEQEKVKLDAKDAGYKPSSEEGKLALQSTGMHAAHQAALAIENNLAAGWKPTDVGAQAFMPFEAMKPAARKAYEVAQDQWITNMDRGEGVNRFNKEAKESLRKQYFGQSKDPPELIAAKQAQREQIEANMRTLSGRAAGMMQQASQQPASQQAPNSDAIAAEMKRRGLL
jgi:hypothetical protein